MVKDIEPHISVIVEMNESSKPNRPKTQKEFEDFIGFKF